jgi:hypothetical protein
MLLAACNTPLNTKHLSKELPYNPDIGGGQILFYTTSGNYIASANVGNLPDVVTFTPLTGCPFPQERV